MNRTRFIHMLAVGLFDILFALPAGASVLTISIMRSLHATPVGMPFYPGWHHTHDQWSPIFVPTSQCFWCWFHTYHQRLLYPVISLIIFLIFGLTPTSRSKYRCWFWAVCRLPGIQPLGTVRDDRPGMTFRAPPRSSTNTGTRCVILFI